MNEAEVSDEEYAAPLGRLLLAVADTEGAAGELVVLKTHSSGPINSAWFEPNKAFVLKRSHMKEAKGFVSRCLGYSAAGY
jgi:hypothetical protein